MRKLKKVSITKLALNIIKKLLSSSITAFYHDYSNLLGQCTLSSGADCTDGEQFNAGKVAAKGIEFG